MIRPIWYAFVVLVSEREEEKKKMKKKKEKKDIPTCPNFNQLSLDTDL